MKKNVNNADDYNNNNSNNVSDVDDDGGYDVVNDYCGIEPAAAVPSLKAMSAMNTVRCTFHEKRNDMCALENLQKIG